jgi:hypothetical protein
MFGFKVSSIVGGALVTLALAGSIATGGTRTVDGTPVAGSIYESGMYCPEGTGAISFGLPLDGPARMSLFAFRVNGGEWQFTNWYYSARGVFYFFNGSNWEDSSMMAIELISGSKLVEGFEYRYDVTSGTGGWVALGSCTTSSFFDGTGIVFD